MTTLEIIQMSQRRLVKCLLELDVLRENLKSIDSNDSDYDVIDIQMNVDEASINLGFALADLTDWRESKEDSQNV